VAIFHNRQNNPIIGGVDHHHASINPIIDHSCELVCRHAHANEPARRYRGLTKAVETGDPECLQG
jgi:hypothetical protein